MFLHGAVAPDEEVLVEVNLEGSRKGFAVFDRDGRPLIFNVADPRRVNRRGAIIDPTFPGLVKGACFNYPRACRRYLAFLWCNDLWGARLKRLHVLGVFRCGERPIGRIAAARCVLRISGIDARRTADCRGVGWLTGRQTWNRAAGVVWSVDLRSGYGRGSRAALLRGGRACTRSYRSAPSRARGAPSTAAA
jgi:hypothetical protein